MLNNVILSLSYQIVKFNQEKFISFAHIKPTTTIGGTHYG